jgi:transposase-like protein
VAKVALTYGINPNLLHKWIALHRQEGAGRLPAPVCEISDSGPAAFIPVVTPAATGHVRLDIKLDNGVQADLRCLSRDDVLAILPLLASLPCSVSTRG